MNIKSGIKTSEFWIGLAAVLLGAFLASGVLPSDHWAIKVAGIAAVALASLGYSVSRGSAKGKPGAPLALVCLLALTLTACSGLSAEQKTVFKTASVVAAAGAAKAGDYGFAKAREGCRKLDKDACELCLLGVDMAAAMAAAAKAGMVPIATVTP